MHVAEAMTKPNAKMQSKSHPEPKGPIQSKPNQASVPQSFLLGHLRRLPAERNLVIRIRRPPKLNRNLDTQLVVVHHQAREHNDERDARVAHQERRHG